MSRLLVFIGILLMLGLAAGCSGTASSTPTPSLGQGTQDPLPVTLGYAAKPKPTGVLRSYELEVTKAPWELVPGVIVQAITYNGTVPGPVIRVKEGDTLRVVVKNRLEQDTSIHWHGLHVPNAMDGVPGVTQASVQPGETFTYEFIASHAGTFIYHPHVNSVEQIDNGLYGLLVMSLNNPIHPLSTRSSP